ncbi:hypothetical protein PpBr36_00081 [Pyricularia pennisetigena]|uniref:hypothetical protein n=1 Tax=Pyricularia pennisetigena TaxID=1578925 RepID=UPI00114FBC9B|nr:hypothetical protein PpBr36_00081 [Pyricularia pennisetigena]TLS29034.1 hypothetical protein PpBr36_00081 [Pyricularia pennisetigena]
MSSTSKNGANGSKKSSSGGNKSSSRNGASSSSSKGTNTSNTTTSAKVPEPTQCGICKEWYALGDDHTCDLNDPYAGYYA